MDMGSRLSFYPFRQLPISFVGEGQISMSENFKVEQILAGIYRIPVPLTGNPLKELNSYFFVGRTEQGGRHLLVDTGFRTEECKTAILTAMQQLGVKMEDTDILLTHLHVDHSGNVSDFAQTGNKVYIGRLDGEYLLEIGDEYDEEMGMVLTRYIRDRRKRMREHGITEALIREMIEATPSRTKGSAFEFKDYTLLDDGDVLKVGDYRLRAIATPGHTPGELCFDIEGTGAMLLGDHVLFDITPNITDWAGVEDSLGDYLDSLDKVNQYDVVIPLTGHRSRGDFHERVASLKAHHERRLEDCWNVIRELGHARLYEITGMMKWKIRAANWDTFPATQRWFALGECLSHIDYLLKRGRIIKHEDKEGIWYEAES